MEHVRCFQNKEIVEDVKKTVLVGDLVWLRQEKMLGHVLRRDAHDLIRMPTVDDNLARPHQLWKRVGRPKDKWLEDNIDRAFRKHCTDGTDRLRIIRAEKGGVLVLDPLLQHELH